MAQKSAFKPIAMVVEDDEMQREMVATHHLNAPHEAPPMTSGMMVAIRNGQRADHLYYEVTAFPAGGFRSFHSAVISSSSHFVRRLPRRMTFRSRPHIFV